MARPAQDSRARVAVLGLGGTIAMTASEDGDGVLPRLTAGTLLTALPGLEAIAEVVAEDITVVPGPHLTLETMVGVRDAVERVIADGADGVVVTQGTDTIEETAYALELLYPKNVPLVVTGALRNPDEPGADGPANLFGAVRVAADPDATGRGVLVVLNETIHAANRVAKAHVRRPDAFVSRAGSLGEIVESRVHFRGARQSPAVTAAAGCRHPAPVALLATAAGEDGRLLDIVAELGYRGVVIDAMGGGHVPPPMAKRLEHITPALPVVIASRTGAGTTLRETYAYAGGELDLARRGAISAGWLQAHKSRVALSLLLGAGAGSAEIRDFFASAGGG